MELNVDVICNDTGEIFKEGVLLANAHIYIAKRGSKVVKDEVENLEMDDIDGGEDIEVRNLWVEFPEMQEEMRKAGWKKVQGFWRY